MNQLAITQPVVLPDLKPDYQKALRFTFTDSVSWKEFLDQARPYALILREMPCDGSMRFQVGRRIRQRDGTLKEASYFKLLGYGSTKEAAERMARRNKL